MNIKKWEVSTLNRERAADISQAYNIPSFLAMMLDIRGFISEEEISAMLYGGHTLSDPFELKDMDLAVARIQKAIVNFEKIAIYGDYDVDGISATAILYHYLETVGANVIYYIPQRESEGYGMNIDAVSRLAKADVELIITVDNGISAVNEIKHANALGVDVVVTDHHRPHETLPPAVAVVDPFRADCPSTFKELSGAGVALKLIIALENGDEQTVIAEYADLATLGTVGDVMPMTDENRLIVQTGLSAMFDTAKPGLAALLNQCGCKSGSISSRTLAFMVIPRINATGRMGSPDRAVRLLTCEDPEEAEALTAEICAENETRKTIEAEISAQAVAIVESDPALRYDRVLVIDGDNWHQGVIGIVASRVTDYFGKPCLIISKNGDQAKGSGRSISGFSLFEAISSCADLLEKYGGHPMAVGLSLQSADIERLRIKINQYAKTAYNEMPAQTITLDCKLNPSALSPSMPEILNSLEPFGAGNPQPVFGLAGMKVENIIPVGGGKHLRLVCSKNGHSVNCMRFGMTATDFPYPIGSVLDLIITLDSTVFRGEPQLTVQIKEMRLSGLDFDQCLHTYQVYEKYMRNESLTLIEANDITPSREEIADVYRLVSAQTDRRSIFCYLKELPSSMNLGKLLICLEILEERKLGSFTRCGEIIFCRLNQMNGRKINIYEAAFFLQVKQLLA